MYTQFDLGDKVILKTTLHLHLKGMLGKTSPLELKVYEVVAVTKSAKGKMTVTQYQLDSHQGPIVNEDGLISLSDAKKLYAMELKTIILGSQRDLDWAKKKLKDLRTGQII